MIKDLSNGKINIMIVNFNTQILTDICIQSINKHTKNTNIYVFDNSDKQPFINTFGNVTVLDNTNGQIINFEEWLSSYPSKNPMSNNYGSAKHCYTIQKFMDMFDDNFILMDSDVIVKKDISELYDSKYIFVADKIGKYVTWGPRILPYICFINNKMCKENGVRFFDDKRMGQLYDNNYHDTGASFLEDASKFTHKIINHKDYIDHLAAGSWLHKDILKFANSNFSNIIYDGSISIIIPCFNQGKYVKETIESVKKQICEDFCCIIVNDGSTDNSEEVILENIKGDSRFRYFKTENKGVAHARNFGINKTNSKYILCLDSDDKISTAYIECAVRYLNNHPDTSVFYGNAIMFYDNGNMAFWKLPKFSYSSLLDVNSIYCSCVYRRKDYERVGGYDESMKGYEDWEFLIRLLYKNDNVYKTNDFVFYYRRHEGSRDTVVRNDVKEIKEYIKSKNKKLFNIVKKQNVPITLIKCNDKDNFYGNLSDLRNIDKNILKDKKYVAVYQNGKRFNFPNEAPTVDEVFSKYDSVVVKPLIFETTVREHYATNHNIEDFNIIEKIIAEKYPSYVNSWNNFLNGNIFIPYNMFIMKKDDFKKYIEFIFGVLDEYVKIVGTDIKKRIEDNKEKYLKNFYPNNTVEYQYRIGGYAGERLSNVFFMNNFTKMKTYPIVVTEKKYPNEKRA